MGGLARFGCLWALLDRLRLLSCRGAHRRLALRWCLHQALKRVLFWHDFGRELFARDESFLAAGLLILAHPALPCYNITLLCRFTLSLLLLHIDLLHLVLIGANFLVITHFLPIALLHLVLLLLLLLEQKYLLDLSLSKLLIDHLLLCREVILLDLLATALDVQLLALSGSYFILFCVDCFFILALALVLLLHLSRRLHQEELLLLLLGKLILVLTFFILILATLILTLILAILVIIGFSLVLAVQLGINQLLEFLFWDLESVWVLVVLFLQVGNEQLSFLLIEFIDVKLKFVIVLSSLLPLGFILSLPVFLVVILLVRLSIMLILCHLLLKLLFLLQILVGLVVLRRLLLTLFDLLTLLV